MVSARPHAGRARPDVHVAIGVRDGREARRGRWRRLCRHGLGGQSSLGDRVVKQGCVCAWFIVMRRRYGAGAALWCQAVMAGLAGCGSVSVEMLPDARSHAVSFGFQVPSES